MQKKIGITEQYLGTIERGQANTTLDRLDKIADALGCSSNELVCDEAYFDTIASSITENNPEEQALLLETLEFQRKIIKKAQKIKK